MNSLYHINRDSADCDTCFEGFYLFLKKARNSSFETKSVFFICFKLFFTLEKLFCLGTAY